MKIHDKFVIELAEVIKAYGNDPTVKDPLKIPCDYKFYEISGVAICEKSFKKMKRLEDEINAVLDKIKAEIERKIIPRNSNQYDYEAKWQNLGLRMALKVINKYKAESELEDGNDD